MEYNLKIDKEFEELLHPLEEEEFAELERNILVEGIREPIRLWNGTIVDGHNRYNVAKKHKLDYQTKDIQFENRRQVRIWMLRNQIARRNLKDVDRMDIAELLTKELAEEAAERQAEAGSKNLEKYNEKTHGTSVIINDKTSEQSESPRNLKDVDRMDIAVELTKELAEEAEKKQVRESNNPTEFEVQRSNTKTDAKAAFGTFVVGDFKKAFEKINVQKEAARIAGVSTGKYAQYQIVKANKPEAVEKIRKGESTVLGEYKKIVNAAKKEEKKAFLEQRAQTLNVNDLGITEVSGLFSKTDITASKLTFCALEKDADIYKQKIAGTLLSNGCLIIIVNHTKIPEAIGFPTTTLKYRGDTVLNYDGKIKHALTFSESSQDIPQYLEGTQEEVYTKLIEAHTVIGDIVMFPIMTQENNNLEELSILASKLKRKAIVFSGAIVEEVKRRYQGIREKMYGPVPANLMQSPNYAPGCGYDDNLVMTVAEAEAWKAEHNTQEV